MTLGIINYWIVIVLMMTGLYVVIESHNLIKKIVGLNIFQVSVFMLYISMGKVTGGTAPILAEGLEVFSNPLNHCLILTAIVVGIMFLLGMEYNQCHHILPFIAIGGISGSAVYWCAGIGIDDMFVIMECWYNQLDNHSHDYCKSAGLSCH